MRIYTPTLYHLACGCIYIGAPETEMTVDLILGVIMSRKVTTFSKRAWFGFEDRCGWEGNILDYYILELQTQRDSSIAVKLQPPRLRAPWAPLG